MSKKSYYKDGEYIDVTTGKTYIPKGYCQLCGKRANITIHHFLNQQKCLRDMKSQKIRFPKMWTKDFIIENQKLFELCLQCHSDVEHLSDERFKDKYRIERSYFIYKEEN